jgi:transposase
VGDVGSRGGIGYGQAVNEKHPRRAELYRIIERLIADNEQLRAEVVRLQARVAELESALSDQPAPERAWVKANKPARTGAKKVRQKRTQQFARRRSVPEVVIEHAVARCATCDCALRGGTVKRHREVIEVPLAPAVVTDHVLLERVCPLCGVAYVPTLTAADGVVGQHRFGPNLLALIGTWREVGRLPVRVIQTLLRTLFAVHVSLGAITGTLHTLAVRGTDQVDAIREAIRTSPVVNADETGWREDGQNGYVWQVSTPTNCYFERGRRTNEQIDRILGKDFAGVLVSDFYAAYNHFPGEKQRCWAHLLRDVRDVLATHPADLAVQRWGRLLRRLFHTTRDHPGADPVARRHTRQRAEAILTRVCTPFLDAAVPQRVLCQRIIAHLHELFTFVTNPAVPPTNNQAERTFRPLVIARKIWGGTRSEPGSLDAMRRASLVATWHRQGRNPFTEFLALLHAPRPRKQLVPEIV